MNQKEKQEQLERAMQKAGYALCDSVISAQALKSLERAGITALTGKWRDGTYRIGIITDSGSLAYIKADTQADMYDTLYGLILVCIEVRRHTLRHDTTH
jgi:hypothetical protein